MKNLHVALLLLVAGCSGAAFSQRNPLMDTVEVFQKQNWIREKPSTNANVSRKASGRLLATDLGPCA